MDRALAAVGLGPAPGLTRSVAQPELLVHQFLASHMAIPRRAGTPLASPPAAPQAESPEALRLGWSGGPSAHVCISAGPKCDKRVLGCICLLTRIDSCRAVSSWDRESWLPTVENQTYDPSHRLSSPFLAEATHYSILPKYPWPATKSQPTQSSNRRGSVQPGGLGLAGFFPRHGWMLARVARPPPGRTQAPLAQVGWTELKLDFCSD